MIQRYGLLGVMSFIVGMAFLTGCSPQPTVSTPVQTSTPSVTSGTPSEEGDAVTKELAKLSDADREAALKQVICPVSGEKLGSMGVPPKVTVDGKGVFICCAGCEESLKDEPAKHLAKLKKE